MGARAPSPQLSAKRELLQSLFWRSRVRRVRARAPALPVFAFNLYFRAAARSVPTGSIAAAGDVLNSSAAFSLNPLAPEFASWSFT